MAKKRTKKRTKKPAPPKRPPPKPSAIAHVLTLVSEEKAGLLRAAVSELSPAELERFVRAAVWAKALEGDLAAARLWLAECRPKTPPADEGPAPENDTGPRLASTPYELQLD